MSLFSGEFPPLRPFQVTTHEAIRQAAREGHKRILVMAPTAAGKTILALNVVKETLGKGNRAMFLCDRKTLISQTSNVSREVGLGFHGIIQADNPMLDLSRSYQIASCQTLMRRGWPNTDVLVVDECHALYKTWVDHITSNDFKGIAIGLSATPFTRGLGKVFTKLINAATMHDLTEQGFLVPMRVFSCRKPDMKDAETKADGEWTDKAAEERELVIVGDVVSEWSKFANGRKTICFGSTILHCHELAKQFNEAGIPAGVICADTPDDERARLFEAFRWGDLLVLVSVEALAKGFDQKDIGCVCDCRPLRKSLSTAIQMWGRGLRSCPESNKEDCVVRGTKIITAKGEKNIEEISLDDTIWDGKEFVAHKGAICRGIKNVITYAGLTATPEHLVKTKEGWRPFGECAQQQIRIVQTGSCGSPIRECEGHFSGNEMDRPEVEATDALPLQVHNLWPGILDWVCRFSERCLKKLPTLQPARALPEMALCPGEWDGSAVSKSQESSLHGLWRAWNRIQVRFGFRGVPLDPSQSGTPEGKPVGSNRQRRSLRTRESALADISPECFAHPEDSDRTVVSSVPRRASRSALRRFNPFTFAWPWSHLRADRGAVVQAVQQAKGEVWDILDCGPRHCFNANGLLVHNCFLLDFSGNIIRFAEDFERVYFNGLDHLDDGEKLDREIRKDEDREPRPCPQCGHIPFARKCVACGFEAAPKSLVEHASGVMEEIPVLCGKKKLAENKMHLWAQVATYSLDHAKPGKDPNKRALALYREITGEWPPRGVTAHDCPRVEPTRNTISKIRSLWIAYAHRMTA